MVVQLILRCPSCFNSKFVATPTLAATDVSNVKGRTNSTTNIFPIYHVKPPFGSEWGDQQPWDPSQTSQIKICESALANHSRLGIDIDNQSLQMILFNLCTIKWKINLISPTPSNPATKYVTTPLYYLFQIFVQQFYSTRI